LAKIPIFASFAALLGVFCLALPVSAGATAFSAGLFGYNQSEQSDTQTFGQWIQVLERHLRIDIPEGDCTETVLNLCHMRDWLAFLEGLRGRSRAEQMDAVNRYANRKTYVLDIDNYGVEDYWAVPREFLYNNGDCEDYAITKLFSLRWLGFPIDDLRLVILQDTNLRIPHAVLAVADEGDIKILDNQIQEVVSQHDIVHYAPVYAINEHHWWLYFPD